MHIHIEYLLIHSIGANAKEEQLQINGNSCWLAVE